MPEVFTSTTGTPTPLNRVSTSPPDLQALLQPLLRSVCPSKGIAYLLIEHYVPNVFVPVAFVVNGVGELEFGLKDLFYWDGENHAQSVRPVAGAPVEQVAHRYRLELKHELLPAAFHQNTHPYACDGKSRLLLLRSQVEELTELADPAPSPEVAETVLRAAHGYVEAFSRRVEETTFTDMRSEHELAEELAWELVDRPGPPFSPFLAVQVRVSVGPSATVATRVNELAYSCKVLQTSSRGQSSEMLFLADMPQHLGKGAWIEDLARHPRFAELADEVRTHARPFHDIVLPLGRIREERGEWLAFARHVQPRVAAREFPGDEYAIPWEAADGCCAALLDTGDMLEFMRHVGEHKPLDEDVVVTFWAVPPGCCAGDGIISLGVRAGREKRAFELLSEAKHESMLFAERVFRSESGHCEIAVEGIFPDGVDVTAANAAAAAMTAALAPAALMVAERLYQPLQSFWSVSGGWFTDGGPISHNPPRGSAAERERERERERDEVARAWPALPASWWKSEASAVLVHKALKSITGPAVERADGARGQLTLGGIFLLGALACDDLLANPFYETVEDWGTHPGLASVFLSSRPTTALAGVANPYREAIRCLFEFFRRACRDQARPERACRVSVQEAGARLVLEMPWRADKSTEGRTLANETTKVLAGYLRQLGAEEEGASPGHLAAAALTEDQTTYWLLRFMLLSNMNSTGFGMAGSVLFDGDRLIFSVLNRK
jgi:hypothetical protein